MKAVGIDKGTLREVLDIQVDDDQWKEFMGRRDAALLGIDLVADQKLGDKYSWEVGREFGLDFIDDLPVYMAGTFVPRDPTLRKVILIGDVFLQDAANSRGVASQILVKVAHRDDIERVTESIMKLPYPSGLHAESQRQALDQALADLDEMLRYASAVMLAVGIVILIGLANATSMAVRERVREVGTLRAIGFSRRKVLGLITVESLLLSVLGGALGCAAAWVIVGASQYSISVAGFAFPLVLSPMLLVAAMGGALLVGILGALPAGLSVNHRPIVDALRSVD